MKRTEGFKSMKVIYLRNNFITQKEQLHLTNLTHLDLQFNKIKRLDGLQCLPSLTHLYLNHNSIEEIVSLVGPYALQVFFFNTFEFFNKLYIFLFTF